MTPAEILERAADVIDKRGLWKYSYCQFRASESGALCASGAIRCVMYGSPFGGPLEDKLPTPVTNLLQAVGQDSLPQWNDTDERTAAEVTSTLRAVAATLRAQEREPMIEPIELHIA